MGAGWGGAYTAWRLGVDTNTVAAGSICIFEANSRVGERRRLRCQFQEEPLFVRVFISVLPPRTSYERSLARRRSDLQRAQPAVAPGVQPQYIDLEFRWCLRMVETGVEAGDDGKRSGEPRDQCECVGTLDRPNRMCLKRTVVARR